MKNYYGVFAGIFMVLSVSCTVYKPDIVVTKSTRVAQADTLELLYKEIEKFSTNETLLARASKKKLRFYEFKFKNKGIDTISIDKNFLEVFYDFEPIVPLSGKKLYRKLKNTKSKYVPIAILGTVGLFHTEKLYTEQGAIIGRTSDYYVGPVSAICFSYIMAGLTLDILGNRKLKKQLTENYLYGKQIMPGQTVVGYIAVKTKQSKTVLMRVK